MNEIQKEARREMIRAARTYLIAKPGSSTVRAAFQRMKIKSAFVGTVEENDVIIHAIRDYIFNPDADDLDCDNMADIVMLPDCPKCGIDGSTTHHADSTDDKPLLTCVVCGCAGYQ